jgi:hypothetical protein
MAAAALPIEQAPPYWSSLIIDGKEIDRSHLDPMTLVCPCADYPRPIVVNVTFSNHCFTDHYIDGIHDPAWKVMDHRAERVFCFTRHGLSQRLPGMVQALPTANVWQTKSDRNFVYAVMLDDGLGTSYPMFFSLKREKEGAGDVAMFVESAYPIAGPTMAGQLKGAPKIRFATLCRKAARNESLRLKNPRG